MRKGVNPEKYNSTQNLLKQHRVIIPVHIPASGHLYFKNSDAVLKICLDSLFNTISTEITDVTIIADGCNETVLKYLYTLDAIDKLVIYKENRGKANVVMKEVRASYEPYVTITDADVLFFPGWWQETVKIFKAFPKSGAVSPVPAMIQSLQQTSCIFFDNYFFNTIKYGSVVSDEDCKLFFRGLNNSALVNRSGDNFNWDEKQYYLKGNTPILIGATHFVATYRRELLSSVMTFPKQKFLKGYVVDFLDIPIDKQGYYRLSTTKCFAYHMGNTIDGTIKMERQYIQDSTVNSFPKIKYSPRISMYSWRVFVFKVIRKLFNI